MVKLRTLHFVNVEGRTVSQHWKKKRANAVAKRLRKLGAKPKIISRRAKWVY